MNKLNLIDIIALLLLIIGGINWGLVGIMGYDLVASIFGEMTLISKIIYDLVGLSALYMLLAFRNLARK